MIFRDDMKFSDEEVAIFQAHLEMLTSPHGLTDEGCMLAQLIVLFFATEAIRRLYMRKDHFDEFVLIAQKAMEFLQRDTPDPVESIPEEPEEHE